MIEKIDIKHLLVIVGVGLAINFLFIGCGKSSTIGDLQASTDRSLGNIKAEQSILGVEVVRIERTSGELGKSVNEATREVGESRRTSEAIANGIERIKLTVGECQRIAGENARIFARVDEADR